MGISSRHGPHHDAHTFTTVLRRPVSATVPGASKQASVIVGGPCWAGRDELDVDGQRSTRRLTLDSGAAGFLSPAGFVAVQPEMATAMTLAATANLPTSSAY